MPSTPLWMSKTKTCILNSSLDPFPLLETVKMLPHKKMEEAQCFPSRSAGARDPWLLLKPKGWAVSWLSWLVSIRLAPWKGSLDSNMTCFECQGQVNLWSPWKRIAKFSECMQFPLALVWRRIDFAVRQAAFSWWARSQSEKKSGWADYHLPEEPLPGFSWREGKNKKLEWDRKETVYRHTETLIWNILTWRNYQYQAWDFVSNVTSLSVLRTSTTTTQDASFFRFPRGHQIHRI